MAKYKEECMIVKKVSDGVINSMKRRRLVFFKDQVAYGKREICFANRKYSKDLVNPYTTDMLTIGLRKMGVHVLGIGRVK